KSCLSKINKSTSSSKCLVNPVSQTLAVSRRKNNMCRTWTLKEGLAAVALFAATVLAQAEINPPNCGGANASDLPLNANTGGPVQVGQTIEHQVVLLNPLLNGGGQHNCGITNANAVIRLPNGQQFLVLTNISLDPGQSIICPGNPLCATNSFGPANFGYAYVVRLQDLVHMDPTLCPPPPGPVTAISARAFGSAVVLNGTVNGAK